MTITSTILTMPQYWIELDEESIDRAIAAVAAHTGLPAIPQGSGGAAEYLVATVMKALETPPEKRTVVYGWNGKAVNP